MKSLTTRFALLVAVSTSAPALYAQTVGQIFDPCCNACGRQPCACAATHPVVETRYRQQNCLSYTTVKRTGCRTEPYCETVPVTKVDCVTVDEGCYQMIWVPKPVTKAVPRTEFHQRTAFRQVPFEYCEQVPVVTSRIVPEQWVRYVTEHKYYTSTPATPVCPPEPCPPGTIPVGGGPVGGGPGVPVGGAPGVGPIGGYGPGLARPGYPPPGYGPGVGAGVGPYGAGVGLFGVGAGVGPRGVGVGVGPVGAGVGPGGIGVGVGNAGIGVGPFVTPTPPVGINGNGAPLAVPYSASRSPAMPSSVVMSPTPAGMVPDPRYAEVPSAMELAPVPSRNAPRRVGPPVAPNTAVRRAPTAAPVFQMKQANIR